MLRIFAAFLFALAFSAPAFAADKSGSFKANKARYSVSGTATVTTSGGKTTIKLSGFKTSPGPDLYVYVGNGSPTKRIAKLKKNSGSQTYTFNGTPKISTVHIHCKRFSSTFGTARLN